MRSEDSPPTPDPQRPRDWRSDQGFWFRPHELPRRPRRTPHGVHGEARLANAADLETLLAAPGRDPHALRLPGVTLLAEATPDGGRLEPLLHRDLFLPSPLREKHVLAVGGTGCGKTTRLILPQLAADLADRDRAVIALDAKGGVLFDYMRRLARRHRPATEVHQVNFRHPARNTIAWNPLGALRTWSDAFRVAHAVCTNVDRGVPPKDPFWLNSSMNLLADLLLALVEENPAEASLARAKQLIDGYPLALARFLDRRKNRYPAIARVLDGVDRNPNTSIIADLSMRLLLFGDEGVVACTCGENQLELESLIRNAGVLVIEVCEADAAELLPLTNVFVTQLFTHLMNVATGRPDGRLPRPASLILDELGSACGRLPEFESRLATLRSRGVSLIGAVQTLSQLEYLYEGAAGSILGNFNTKIFFGGGLSLEDSRYASRQSGTTTVESIGYLEATRTAVQRKRVTRTRTPVSRPLLLPEEIARPPVHPLLGPPATVFTPDLPPFLAYLPPAYESPECAWAMQGGGRAGPEPETLPHPSGWEQLPEETRQWWQGVVERHRASPGDLRGHLEELFRLRGCYERLAERKKSLLEEWHSAARECGTHDLRAVLAWLHWSLVHRWETQQRNRADDAPRL